MREFMNRNNISIFKNMLEYWKQDNNQVINCMFVMLN